jgi:hypothetical protein
MALFVALHQHQADRCPAADPQMGPMLLGHLSPENASAQGVTIQAEAVVNDAHALYLIVEADSRDRVEGVHGPVRSGRHRGGSVGLVVRGCDRARGPCKHGGVAEPRPPVHKAARGNGWAVQESPAGD